MSHMHNMSEEALTRRRRIAKALPKTVEYRARAAYSKTAHTYRALDRDYLDALDRFRGDLRRAHEHLLDAGLTELVEPAASSPAPVAEASVSSLLDALRDTIARLNDAGVCASASIDFGGTEVKKAG